MVRSLTGDLSLKNCLWCREHKLSQKMNSWARVTLSGVAFYPVMSPSHSEVRLFRAVTL